MKRLIEKGLMFGNLVEVSSPALIDRYNRALAHLTGKRTELTDFHIDISGFSPEVGEELGDERYLNPNGCNRQFILLTTAQKSAPLLNVTFSTSRGILRQFIEANEAQLFALTARDAVAGELANSVFEVSSPTRLLDIRQITIEADTIGGHVADAAKLAQKIERFRQEPAGWRDDVLIAEMIGMAKKTGDVTRVPIALPKMTFEQANFWTSHFGGLYVFRDVKLPAVISVMPQSGLEGLVMDLSSRNRIADWLERCGLVEPIVKARAMDSAAVLRQKMDFILVDAADALNLDLGLATRNDLRKIARQLGAALPEEFQGLSRLLAWVEGGGDWPRITSEHPAYFYTLRARAHADRDLVNMLLSQLAPLDVRQMFITHKELFYSSYASWSDRKRGYVADFLEREYMVDKAGARRALFGAEPAMDEAERAAPKAKSRRTHLAGPWGPARKGRR
ncbi:hypothetical protein EOK75_10935 [Pseudorhodobacter turbinis]|uniref:Uncharacterized protein n=1 Tax=Pseudorhodobacter turbinis TaxID=2500533 RepID=A0A4P8EGY7_9RHOB|nr:DUF6638 family protein [Pseudorhodobacter turbinis]QCO56196.1 hypothetical protein EOK75_10935 [Pseudorhodobacter turbinis]